jgi:hypothetical protein
VGALKRSEASSSNQPGNRFSAVNPQKRLSIIAESVESDGDFESNDRAAPSSAKRQRLSQHTPSNSILRWQSDALSGRVTTAADDAALRPDDVPALTQTAKANARRSRPSSTGPQRRTFWPDEDVVKLISAVSEYECAWSTIEAKMVTHFSVPRNQQAIRDKARNLKVDFLKADLVLPAGFDNIALGKKERDLVIKCRRNPDRMEADVRDGIVINEIYLPPDAEAQYEAEAEAEAYAEAQEEIEAAA